MFKINGFGSAEYPVLPNHDVIGKVLHYIHKDDPQQNRA